MATPTISDIAGITAEPVLRFTPNGKAVLDIRLAFNDSKFDDQQKAWVTTRTFYVDATAWEQTAERLAEQLKKGDQVFVVGRLETQSWEKDGERRSKPSLTVQTVRKLAPNVTAQQPSSGFAQAPGQPAQTTGWTNHATGQPQDPWQTTPTEPPF